MDASTVHMEETREPDLLTYLNILRGSMGSLLKKKTVEEGEVAVVANVPHQ